MKEQYQRTHKLKILPHYLDRILSGQKRFEIRKNDRDFQVGDWVQLIETFDENWDVSKPRPINARSVQVQIIYISDFEQKPGYVVFGFAIGCALKEGEAR